MQQSGNSIIGSSSSHQVNVVLYVTTWEIPSPIPARYISM